jgi:hypothetical protein
MWAHVGPQGLCTLAFPTGSGDPSLAVGRQCLFDLLRLGSEKKAAPYHPVSHSFPTWSFLAVYPLAITHMAVENPAFDIQNGDYVI